MCFEFAACVRSYVRVIFSTGLFCREIEAGRKYGCSHEATSDNAFASKSQVVGTAKEIYYFSVLLF